LLQSASWDVWIERKNSNFLSDSSSSSSSDANSSYNENYIHKLAYMVGIFKKYKVV
jgi:hypothetical protein